MELKEIDEMDGNYFIDECGNVTSRPRQGAFGKSLKQQKSQYGYFRVILYKDRKAIAKTIHRLVATAFLSNPDNLPQINHKDGNKENNHVSNLEWCTSSYNIRHAFRMGLSKSHTPKGADHPLSKLTDEKVVEMRRLRTEKKLTQKELSEIFGVSPGVVQAVVNRKAWKHI